MQKCVPIGLCGQNHALRAHVWAENGPKTAETRPDLVHRDRIRISTRVKTLVRVHTRVTRVLNLVTRVTGG